MFLLFLLLLLSIRIVKLNKRITWPLLPFSCTKRKILTFSVLQFSVSLCFTFVFHNYSIVIHPVKMVIDRQYRDKVFKGDSVCKIWSIWSFKTDHNYHFKFFKSFITHTFVGVLVKWKCWIILTSLHLLFSFVNPSCV